MLDLQKHRAGCGRKTASHFSSTRSASNIRCDRGAGKRLSSGRGAAQAFGATRLLLEVEETNDAARRLYDSTGFRPIARRDNYYGAGRHALVCALDLEPQSIPSPEEIEIETEVAGV